MDPAATLRSPLPELEIHTYATWTEIALAAVTFVALLFITAPYGRHGRGGWGPEVPQRTAWILMEFPAVIVWIGIYLAGAHAFEVTPLVLLAIWQSHYVYRTFVYPFRIRASGKTTPSSIIALAIAFNLLNAYVNARWVSELGAYPASWLLDPRFLIGLAVFVAGYAINHHSDYVLMRLRKPGETGYKIPRGGLHDYVSSPNYFGELLEWTGWAIATWSLAGLAFALYTFANLAPRARDHRRWYAAQFPDYPKERRALLPFLW